MLKTDDIIYHVETQEDYDDLIIELKKLGCNFYKSDVNYFKTFKEKTCVRVLYNELFIGHIDVYPEYAPQVEIIKYKKGQNNMKVKLKASEQFVADWYEENKEDLEYNIYTACTQLYDVIRKSTSDEDCYPESMFLNWLGYSSNKPTQTLVKMHLFGYEVEKEPLYYIELPYLSNYNNNPQRICKNNNLGNYFACGEYGNRNHKFTKLEIMENIPWAWQFAREV